MIALALLACGEPAADTVMVVVAARDLSVGVPIEEGDVYGVAMAPGAIPPGSFVTPGEVIGRVPSSRILANEPINARRLADAELQRMLEALVPPGLEVTTVPLDPGAERPPVPGKDLVQVGLGGLVVATGLPVYRVDGRLVAVMATPDQMRAISEARQGEAEPTVTVAE